MSFYEMPGEQNAYFLEKGTPMPLCCPKCRKAVPIGENQEQAEIRLKQPTQKCLMCDYEGPTEEFNEVEWVFIPMKQQ